MRREVEAGLTELRRQLLNPTLNWNGAIVPYLRSTLRRGEEVVVGGKLVTIDSTLFIQLVHMPSGSNVPSAGKLITVDGIEYRIATVRLVAPRSHYEVAIFDKNT